MRRKVEVSKERNKKEIMQNDDINEFNYINGRGSLISGFLLFGVFFICIKGRFELPIYGIRGHRRRLGGRFIQKLWYKKGCK